MSVDYDANYGIGYQVYESEELPEADLEDGLAEYIESEAGKEFEGFEVGNLYSGEMDGNYLIIKDPFKDGLDLTSSKEKVDKEVKRLKLEIYGDFGLVGGLFVC